MSALPDSRNAHDRLDRAVFAAYGLLPNLSDKEVLKNLLALNLECFDPSWPPA